MSWFFQKKQEEGTNYSKKLIDIEDKLSELSRRLKDLEDNYEKLEIKALESRKIYSKKLKNLVGDEEKSELEEAKSINNPVILPFNGVNFRS